MSQAAKKNIDITSYVAIGDSITSGYMDGALFYEGQLNSYANLIAGQLKLRNSLDFKQPLMKQGSVGIGFYGNSRLMLKKSHGINGKTFLEPVFVAPNGDISAFAENIFKTQGPFQNISVPGAKVISLVSPGFGNPENGPGNYNPFFYRIASNAPFSSILSDALALRPSFFTLFIGNNDILTYASSGGTSDFITPVSGEPGQGFEGSFRTVINSLTENGAKGAIANLPDIDSVPFFTVIPYDGLFLTKDEAQVLNTTYKFASLHFQEGKNPFVIQDPLADARVRKIEKGELIILDAQLDPAKNIYLKGHVPIPKNYVLARTEVDAIRQAVTSYNKIIQTIASEKNLALVDVNSFTKLIKKDIVYNHQTLCAGYKKRSVFSLDGLHLSPFGEALLANIFIKAINATYGSGIPHVNIIKYKGIAFP